MQHHPTADVLKRAIRAKVCTTCYQRPAGSESMPSDAPRNCEPLCPIFVSMPRLMNVAAVCADAPISYEESIKELVKNGLGIGVVAQWPIRAELQSGELVTRPLGEKPLARQWYAVHLRGRTLTEAENLFLRFFQRATANLAESSVSAPAMARV